MYGAFSMAHLKQNEPSLKDEEQRLARCLSSQCWCEASCHLLRVVAPLAPHMLKQLLGQLHHDSTVGVATGYIPAQEAAD